MVTRWQHSGIFDSMGGISTGGNFFVIMNDPSSQMKQVVNIFTDLFSCPVKGEI